MSLYKTLIPMIGDVSFALTSQICTAAMLLLLITGSYKAPRWRDFTKITI